MQQDQELRTFIRDVRRRWFVHAGLRTAGRAAAGTAVAALAGLVLSWVLRPDGLPLLLLALVTAVASIAAAALIVRRMQRRPDDRQVARYIEERTAELPGRRSLDDALVSAVDEACSPPSAALRPLLVRVALDRLAGIRPEQIVSSAKLRRAAAEAIAGITLLVIVLAASRATLGGVIETAWVALFPQRIHVEVLPGDVRVVAGQPVTIRAVVRAGGRVLTRLTPALTVSAGVERRTVAMAREMAGFVFPFESIDRSFRYTVAAGSVISSEYTVTALFAPRVKRIELRYEYPAFTGLEAREEEDGGDIYAPAGTRVRVRIHTDKPISAGQMQFGAAGRKTLTRASERTLEANLVLARDDSYRVQLADSDGLGSAGEKEFFIRVMDDRPPDVRILRPAGDQQITPLEEVAIEARADDDYGISLFELVYAVPGGKTRTVPFSRISGTDVAKIGAHLLAAEDLRVQPGDVITYYARARDVARGKRPTETRSDMYFLEVRPFSEEFVAAQSQASGGGRGSAQIESLIAAQKEIISATWNIERRSGAGRSGADVKAIAQAQAELKARAEQMTSSGGRGRAPFEVPQQITGVGPREPQQKSRDSRSAPGPIAEAVEAMGRAVEQLQGERTKEAIPHEMAALQGLLQAQAEVRRREVMRQQASGASSGASGRQGQDLSALFDKELQRQQRTNYETRSQVEERPDQRENDSAMDRIRDLARRQEDLSKRERELANQNLSSEELKRQLEKLTREQSELREHVEELARQMGQQNAQSRRDEARQQAQSSQGQPGRQQFGQGQEQQRPGAQRGNAGGDIRNASEQMRSAASELRRQDPGAAAESSARAAEQLRQIEQQLRGESPQARQRMAGELQLEVQQIAEEQRRIAGEASRLDKGDSAANADARRRLAGEKERLAERADALQRSVSELARQNARQGTASNAQSRRARGAGEGTPSARVGEAARELERQQIGRRMRESAKTMRESAGVPDPSRSDGGSRQPAAAAEEQIATALEKVVEQLGGGTAEARNLSAQLGHARGVRERLDRLETQIREAEARERAAGEHAPSPNQSGAEGRQGREGQQGASGSGQGGELQRLREEYARELQRSRDTLSRLQQGTPRGGQNLSTPEQHEWSQSAPGNEAFKQDFSRWESLRKDVNLALERYEAALSAQMAKKSSEDRLNAGGSDGVPEAYRQLIAQYYEALARPRK